MSKDSNNNLYVEKEESFEYGITNKLAFSEFYHEKLQNYNYENGKEYSLSDIGEMLGITAEVFRKKINRQRPSKDRDFIIAVCVALNLSTAEIDKAFILYDMPSVDLDILREDFIYSEINKNIKITIPEINEKLKKIGFPELKIHSWRNGGKKLETGVIPTEYKIVNSKVTTSFDEIAYEKYNALDYKFSPSRYELVGEMWVENKKMNQVRKLVIGNHGEPSIYDYKNPIPKFFDDVADTGEFKMFFLKLNSQISSERRKLLQILNDTKNYGSRISAKYSDSFIRVFSEEFNYSLPEFQEYYCMELCDNNYVFTVYKTSRFMKLYLSEEEYKKNYSDVAAQEVDKVTSETEYDDIINSESRDFKAKHLAWMRKKAYIKMKTSVKEMYDDIQANKINIRDFYSIFDYKEEIISYYKLEKEFGEIYDNETVEVTYSKSEADMQDQNGLAVSITVDDLVRAFELGIDDIQDVIRIKSENGQIIVK